MEPNTQTPQNETPKEEALLPERATSETEKNSRGELTIPGNVPESGGYSGFAPGETPSFEPNGGTSGTILPETVLSTTTLPSTTLPTTTTTTIPPKDPPATLPPPPPGY
jgi:hypothetical protein